MMKKLSLQWRLTLLSALLLAAGCLTVYLFVSNSALMKMDQIEDTIVSIQLTGEDDSIDLGLNELTPSVNKVIETTKRNFRYQCLLITICVILCGSGLTWWISGLVLKPLRTLTQEVGEISEQNLSDQLPIPASGDEIAELTRSFNHMLLRLDNAFQSQKQFTANAAHELRTPLSIMETNLEVFRKKADATKEEYNRLIDRTLTQTDRLSSLVNSLLELLSLHNVPLEDDIELHSLTEEIICDLLPLALNKEVTLTLEGQPCHKKGSDALMYRAIYNLIENAIKYNHPGGYVKVRIEAEKILVEDSGEGIDPSLWDQIFQPFYRIDKARSRSMGGAGLGLALVSDIAQVHGGEAYIESSSKQGTTICLHI